MDRQQADEFLWGDFSPQGQQLQHCVYALKFKQWTDNMCLAVNDAVQQDSTSAAVTVNQAKVLLVDKYFEWRAVSPKSHRNRAGDTSHLCLFHVFDETYRILRAIELSLTPPLLFLPAPPPARVPTKLSIADVASFG